jgi:gamma-glutamyltranspeptidase/glutathione hydrolase
MYKHFNVFLILNYLLLHTAYAIYPKPVISPAGMVVTEHYLASQVGADILKRGGNAIDAAVAVGYTLAVTHPCCGNIGGGGFMLIHLANGKNTFINFREKAPLAAKPDLYLDQQGNVIPNKSLFGYSAVGVPGTVLGLEYALKKYGTMSRDTLMAPAIKMAKEGFVITEPEVPIFAELKDEFPVAPNVAPIFLQEGNTLQTGQKLVQVNLANTLELISKEGSDVFYKGPIASKIVKASQAEGGYLVMDDFTQYTVQELSPIYCQYRGFDVITSPPPSSGGVTLCEMLGILEKYDLQGTGFHSAQSVHYIVEAMRYAFADRNTKLGDPDFIKNPIQELLSKDYIKKLQNHIQDYRTTPSTELPYKNQVLESTQTTHYSIADAKGNLVAVTYTLNGYFGARVIAGDTGFFLNNQMDDFTAKPGVKNQFGLVEGANNSIQPGKRPLSSMTPTIVFHKEQPLLVLGSPGGPRIITAILQTLINFIDYKMDIKASVDASRFHHQWLPDYIDMEPFTFSQDTIEKLAYMGYRFRTMEPWSNVEAIHIDNHKFLGANDDRVETGLAIGP